MSARVGNTPMRAVRLMVRDAWRQVHLKLEQFNPTGSSKDRAAAFLLADLELRGLLTPTRTIVESSSGNLSVALASLCRARACPFLAVIDPKTTPENRGRLAELGAEVEIVAEPDASGGYLLSRLNRVRELCDASSRFVWTDQYGSRANPDAHYLTTGPEIYGQMSGRVDAVFIAVSTGGTLAGIGRYFREVSPRTRIVAVDVIGSVVFGGPAGPRHLTGIGSSRRSSFIGPDLYDCHELVSDRDAFAICRQMDEEVDLRLGGSSGAVLAACARHLARVPALRDVVCVCPDGGENYRSTIYSDEWLAGCGMDPGHRASIVQRIGSLCGPKGVHESERADAGLAAT